MVGLCLHEIIMLGRTLSRTRTAVNSCDVRCKIIAKLSTPLLYKENGILEGADSKIVRFP